MFARDGFVVFDTDPRVTAWASAAAGAALQVEADPVARDQHLRHGGTWFVGVDALPNGPQGEIGEVPLAGPWQAIVPQLGLHRAQLSIIYPGYPKRDVHQSEANHRYRVSRCAAHVDGLLPEGPGKRRFAREYHAYILGLPLNDVADAPTVVWRGSHRIMQAVLAEATGDAPVGTVDLTEAYHAARRQVFERCERVPLRARVGQSYVIHRFALHGTAPWPEGTGQGRMVAFFRPEFSDPGDWLPRDVF